MNTDLILRGNELLYDAVVSVFTLNRFELSRMTLLGVLAFAPNAGRLLVIDDHSEDKRLVKWLHVLADHKLIDLVECKTKRRLGNMYRWLAKSFTDGYSYMISLDNDVLIGPDTLQTLTATFDHWSHTQNVVMLGSFGIARHPPVPDGSDLQMLDRYADTPLFIVDCKVFHEMYDDLRPARRRPFTKFSQKLRQRGMKRSLQVTPRVNAVHLGSPESSIEKYAKEMRPPGLYGWFPEPCEPLPDLDVCDCELRYPRSIWELGTRIRDDYTMDALHDALIDADKESGYAE